MLQIVHISHPFLCEPELSLISVTGGVLAPFSLSGGGAHLCPVNAVALVPRESSLPPDRKG